MDYIAIIVWVCILIIFVLSIIGSIWTWRKYSIKTMGQRGGKPECKEEISKQMDDMYKERGGELKKESASNDDGLFTQIKRKIASLLLILLTGEVPVDNKNPKKSKEESEKEIRETDCNRVRMEAEAKEETNKETKKELISSALRERDKFFDLKYKLLNSEQTKERRAFWRTVVIIYLVFFFIEAILSLDNFSIVHTKIKMNTGLTLFIFQMLYTVASLRQVGETELGALSFLSKFILNTGSGLVFVPLGFCRIFSITKGIIVQELPDEAENIVEPIDKAPTPKGKSTPMYIICGHPKGEGREDDPLHARLTGRATPVVTYRAISPCDFFSYVGSLKEARRRMTDVASAMLGTEIAKTTYSEVIENMAKYNRLLSMAITRKIDGYSERNSKPWGLHFEDAWLKPFLFGEDLHKSMAQLVEAKFKKEATIINANADREKVILGGEATASVIKNEADALTDALVKRKEDLRIDSELVYVGEVAEKIADGNTVLVGSDGFKEILGLSKTIVDVVKIKKGAEEK